MEEPGSHPGLIEDWISNFPREENFSSFVLILSMPSLAVSSAQITTPCPKMIRVGELFGTTAF